MTRASRALVLSFFVCAAARLCADDTPKFDFQQGPGQADLGKNVAEIKYGEKFVFADAKETKRVMEAFGNQVNGNEVGFIAPKAEDENWFVVFEWEDVGYVKDDEKDAIDADKLFASIKEGTEQANKHRRENGMPTLTVTGWDEKPHYDRKTNNLVWSLLAADSQGNRVVNYNVRLLGRDGVMSVTLVTDPATLDTVKPQLGSVIGGFSYKQGKRYAEWRSGDKVAKYGLAALVTGGAGVAAVKLGLFAAFWKVIAKAWKLVAVGVIAAGAALKRGFNAFFGKDRSGVNPT
jgi:uncharacterized membrane-anchored protein